MVRQAPLSLAATLAVAASLAGCGLSTGGDDPFGEPAPAESDVVQPVEEPAEEPAPEEPVAEEPPAEEPVAEEPVVDEPPAEDTAVVIERLDEIMDDGRIYEFAVANVRSVRVDPETLEIVEERLLEDAPVRVRRASGVLTRVEIGDEVFTSLVPQEVAVDEQVLSVTRGFASSSGDLESSDRTLVMVTAIGPVEPTEGYPELEYVNFGVWAAEPNEAQPDYVGEAFYGGGTAPTALPPGYAFYEGGMVGAVWGADPRLEDEVLEVYANLEASVDFDRRSVSFDTVDAGYLGIERTLVRDPRLNITTEGDLTIDGVTFSGPIRTVVREDGISGSTAGAFFGPDAEELGGTFRMESADGGISYVGAYGGARTFYAPQGE